MESHQRGAFKSMVANRATPKSRTQVSNEKNIQNIIKYTYSNLFCSVNMSNSISMAMIILFRAILVIILIKIGGVTSDPQATLLRQECTQSPIADDVSDFLRNVNKTFGDIRKQLSNNSNIRFATAFQNDVFGLAQCRNYLSTADCITCFDVAYFRLMRSNCRVADTGRVIYEGCFLRYEAHNFFAISDVTFGSSAGICSTNGSKIEASAFTPAVEGVLADLAAATPQINGYFAAITRPVFDSGATATATGTVYAVAQCIETISRKDCQNCLTVAYNNNIKSCPPASGGSSVDTSCFLRYSDTAFFADKDIVNIAPYLGQGRRGGRSSQKTTITGSAVGGLCLILLMTALILWYQLLRRPKMGERDDILGVNKLKGPVIYNFKDLKSATNSFSEQYKIGEGGFGDVYKGIIKNGDVVAVKKLTVTTSKAKTDFESEIRLISNVNHRNIIRLLGCSAKGSERLLVFEYMEKGSLDTFLYGEKRGTLNWKQRHDIIFGIARGLAYLHEQFHSCIIHRDIKSSNILLDDDFQPKISDFGLARLIREDQSHVTTRCAGTLGYTAPEYAIHGHLSEKVDTYSFGIVVLEIISGRRCTGLETDTGSLLEHAWKLYENNMHLDLVDGTLDPNEYKIEYVKNVIELALLCTQSPTSLRPTMSHVVVLLTNMVPSSKNNQANQPRGK